MSLKMTGIEIRIEVSPLAVHSAEKLREQKKKMESVLEKEFVVLEEDKFSMTLHFLTEEVETSIQECDELTTTIKKSTSDKTRVKYTLTKHY